MRLNRYFKIVPMLVLTACSPPKGSTNQKTEDLSYVKAEVVYKKYVDGKDCIDCLNAYRKSASPKALFISKTGTVGWVSDVKNDELSNDYRASIIAMNDCLAGDTQPSTCQMLMQNDVFVWANDH